jgi:hypothetical protein
MRVPFVALCALGAAACADYEAELGFCGGVEGKPVIDHTLLGHGLYFDHDPGETEVFLEAADYDDFRARVRPDLPDVDFSQHHVLVASAFVEDACNLRLGGYALVELEPGLAHLGLNVEASRERCDEVCEGPKWYTVVLTVPAGHGGSACSAVQERCG